MPRTIEEILDHADELAARFEEYAPADSDGKDATALRAISEAVAARADSERRIAEAVCAARADGHSWSVIGVFIGTSGEAARQRYGAASTNR